MNSQGAPVFLAPVSVPPRTNEHIESVVSFARRLAEKNHLSASTFINGFVFRIIPRPRDCGNADIVKYVRGADEALPFIAAIEFLSRCPGLANLTARSLFQLSGVSYLGGAYKYKRWCAMCLNRDIKTLHGPYERLLWSLHEVEVCATHRQRLTFTCPHCKASKIPLVTQFDCSGFCGRCLGWLGSPSLPLNGASEASPYDIWAVRQLATLLGFSPSPKYCLLIESMTMLADKHFSGMRQEFGWVLGKSKGTVSGWMNGQHRLSLRNLLEMSYVFNVPALELLRCTEASIDHSKLRDLPTSFDQTPRRSAVPRNVEADIRFLTGVANGQHPAVRTNGQLEERLAVASATLRKNCAAAYRLARSFQKSALAEARRQAREQSVHELERRVREAYASLVRACRRPSRRAVLSEMEHMGSKPVGRHHMPLVIKFCRLAADSGNSKKR